MKDKPTPKARRRILFDIEPRKEIRKPAFAIQVRSGERKGDKFVDSNIQPLPKNRAITRLLTIVDNTTAASGKIIRKGTTIIRDISQVPPGLKEKFRSPKGRTKLPRNTFVEIRSKRIDTLGEVFGIPFSPIRIPRLKAALARKAARKQRKLPAPLTIGRGRRKVFL